MDYILEGVLPFFLKFHTMYASVFFLLLIMNPFNGLDSLTEKKKPRLILITKETIDFSDNYVLLIPPKKSNKKKKIKYGLEKNK